MQIAITGGSGGVGRVVTALALAQGHTVVSIDRARPAGAPPAGVTFVEADITDYDALAAALRGCQGLIHLAAIPSPGGFPAHVVHNNNVVGSYNALCAAVEAGIRRVCQASSVNATGAAYSRWPRYDYFPLDERHPTYNEDPYSLSKWICEQQADSLARRYEDLTIASLRFHWVVPDKATVLQHDSEMGELTAKHLWGYTLARAAARACLLSLTAAFKGHEVFYIIAPETATASASASLDLQQRHFPAVPVRGDLSGDHGFFDCSKAERLLGWTHAGP